MKLLDHLLTKFYHNASCFNHKMHCIRSKCGKFPFETPPLSFFLVIFKYLPATSVTICLFLNCLHLYICISGNQRDFTKFVEPMKLPSCINKIFKIVLQADQSSHKYILKGFGIFRNKMVDRTMEGYYLKT